MSAFAYWQSMMDKWDRVNRDDDVIAKRRAREDGRMAQDRMYLACTHPECELTPHKLYLARQPAGEISWGAVANLQEIEEFFYAHEECGAHPERPFRIKYEGE